MPKQPDMLNVREYIKYVTNYVEALQIDIQKYSYTLGPIYTDELPKIKLFGRAILRKHAAKTSRKDIHVETE